MKRDPIDTVVRQIIADAPSPLLEARVDLPDDPERRFTACEFWKHLIDHGKVTMRTTDEGTFIIDMGRGY